MQLQLEAFHRFLDTVKGLENLSAARRQRITEHICEETRVILTRAFGNIGEDEALELRDCFESAASTIDQLATAPDLTTDDRDTLEVYASHVRSRVHHLPLSA